MAEARQTAKASRPVDVAVREAEASDRAVPVAGPGAEGSPVFDPPPLVEPVAAEPAAAEPIAAEPVVREPIVSQPIVSQPVAPKPLPAEPSPVDPVSPQPIAIEPIAAEPVLAEPVAAEPGIPDTPLSRGPASPIAPASSSAVIEPRATGASLGAASTREAAALRRLHSTARTRPQRTTFLAPPSRPSTEVRGLGRPAAETRERASWPASSGARAGVRPAFRPAYRDRHAPAHQPVLPAERTRIAAAARASEAPPDVAAVAAPPGTAAQARPSRSRGVALGGAVAAALLFGVGGVVLAGRGKLDGVAEAFRSALGAPAALDPNATIPPANASERLAYYLARAKAGESDAQLRLAVLYAKGEGTPQDYAAAATWFRAAAEHGVARAQYDLAVLYERGRGVPEDPAEAIAWYRKAAEAGYSLAQYNLAVAYTKGQGTKQDLFEAALWYHRAAAQGVVPAMVNLAILYERGEGVDASPADAYAWYRAAAKRGNGSAYRRAEELLAGFSSWDQTRATAKAADVAASIREPAPEPAMATAQSNAAAAASASSSAGPGPVLVPGRLPTSSLAGSSGAVPDAR